MFFFVENPPSRREDEIRMKFGGPPEFQENSIGMYSRSKLDENSINFSHVSMRMFFWVIQGASSSHSIRQTPHPHMFAEHVRTAASKAAVTTGGSDGEVIF